MSSRNVSDCQRKEKSYWFGREYAPRMKVAGINELQYTLYINETEANIIDVWKVYQF